MRLATRATAVLLAATLGILACSDDENAAPRKPVDPSQLPAPPPLEAGVARPTINVESWPVIDPGAASPAAVTQAIATLRGFGDGMAIGENSAAGTVRFAATPQGARVDLALAGLTFLRKYTLRVHVFGDCSSGGANVGPGYNFMGSSLEQPDAEGAMGLLAALEGDVSGTTTGQEEVAGVAIRGPYSIFGRSVVLHAPPSEESPLGPPLACGVIGLAGMAGE